MKNSNIISSLSSGLVYRNPLPHVSSRHAYFPSVVVLEEGELLASLVIGEAFESVNLDTHTVRSADGGNTWSTPVPLLPATEKYLASNCGRLTALPGGEVVSMVVRSRREAHPDEGLANPENMGFVPTDLLLVRSRDHGKNWDLPQLVAPPLTGPSFEACSAIVPLGDGRWIWPTSTWRGWNGDEPNGMKMIALVSHDKGKTWPEYMEIMNGTAENVIFWEGKVLELSGGKLLAVSWAHDEKQGTDRPNHFALSEDGGNTWSVPASTGLQGQTLALTELPDGRLLSVYRRMDAPGLWLNLSRMEGANWKNEGAACLWGGQNSKLNVRSGQMVQDFNELKFGAPSMTLLPDESVYIVFWCYEQMVSNIRWFNVKL